MTNEWQLQFVRTKHDYPTGIGHETKVARVSVDLESRALFWRSYTNVSFPVKAILQSTTYCASPFNVAHIRENSSSERLQEHNRCSDISFVTILSDSVRWHLSPLYPRSLHHVTKVPWHHKCDELVRLIERRWSVKTIEIRNSFSLKQDAKHLSWTMGSNSKLYTKARKWKWKPKQI